jgi:Predicted membrane protein (DUF2078).
MSTTPQTTGERGDSSPPGDQDAAGLVASATVSGLTLAVAFGLLALNVEWFWVTFVVGFAFVLPTTLGAVAYLYSETDDDSAGASEDSHTPMDEPRMQYARGELSETEFERRASVLENQR